MKPILSIFPPRPNKYLPTLFQAQIKTKVGRTNFGFRYCPKPKACNSICIQLCNCPIIEFVLERSKPKLIIWLNASYRKFLNGPFPASFSLFFLNCNWQIIFNWRCWDSNQGSQAYEATALPTAPQPRAFILCSIKLGASHHQQKQFAAARNLETSKTNNFTFSPFFSFSFLCRLPRKPWKLLGPICLPLKSCEREYFGLIPFIFCRRAITLAF